MCLPLDTVKTRFQAGGYSSLLACARETVADIGIRGLYRGFLPVMLRAAPANAACFAGIESANNLLHEL